MNLSSKEISTIASKVAEHISPLASGARWLKIKYATVYSAIGKDRLKEMAADPLCCIVGFADPDLKTGEWVFDRVSLDEYRTNQYRFGKARERELRKKALRLLRKS